MRTVSVRYFLGHNHEAIHKFSSYWPILDKIEKGYGIMGHRNSQWYVNCMPIRYGQEHITSELVVVDYDV